MEENINPEQPMSEEDRRTAFETFLTHQKRALEETGKALEALLPEGFRVHGSNASKEFTKGFKVLVTAAMQELRKARKHADDETSTETGDDQPVSTTGKTKIKVKVE